MTSIEEQLLEIGFISHLGLNLVQYNYFEITIIIDNSEYKRKIYINHDCDHSPLPEPFCPIDENDLMHVVRHQLELTNGYRQILINGGFIKDDIYYNRLDISVFFYWDYIEIKDAYQYPNRQISIFDSEEVENVLHALVRKCELK